MSGLVTQHSTSGIGPFPNQMANTSKKMIADRTASAPTKLELLQQNYRRKLSRERDRKIQELHQDQSYMSRFDDNQGTRVSVRDFFDERRKLRSENGDVPDIEQHYKQKRNFNPGYTQKYQMRKQEGVGYQLKPPLPNNSAGRDRGKLLAPIHKPGGNVSDDQPPKSYKQNFFNGRQPVRAPGVAGHQSGSATQSPHGLQDDADGGSRIPVVQYKNKTKSFREWREQQAIYAQKQAQGQIQTSSRIPSQTGYNSNSPRQGSQLQQPQAQPQQPAPFKKPYVKGVYGVKKPPQQTESAPLQRKEKRVAQVQDDEVDDEATSELLRKQEELMKMIEMEQEKLKQLQHDRADEDAKAKKEAETRKKRIAERREKQKRIKEEERRRKHSETGYDTDSHGDKSQRPKISSEQQEQDRQMELQIKQEMQAKYGLKRQESPEDDRDSRHEEAPQRSHQPSQSHRDVNSHRSQKPPDQHEEYGSYAQEQFDHDSSQYERYEAGPSHQQGRGHQENASRARGRHASHTQDDDEPVFPTRARVIRSNTRNPSQSRQQQPSYHDYHQEPDYSQQHRQDEYLDDRYTRSPEPERAPPPQRNNRGARDAPQPRKTERPPHSSQATQDIDDLPVSTSQTKDAASFYAQQALNNPDAHGKAGSLVPCPECGKKFSRDRIEKHKNACRKVKHSKRKVFDPVTMRNQGTEFEKYAKSESRRPKTPPAPKSNWRAKHEDFMDIVRYARKAAVMEKNGQAPPPPPKSKFQDDKTRCPHCDRMFNTDAATRHIPICSNLKNKKPGFGKR